MGNLLCQLVPASSFVGGHLAAIPGVENKIDADHIVRGEGVAWKHRYLGENERTPIRQPGPQLRIKRR